ncbi:hypothetical protein K461DRAFT_223055 [Myriangium duriaei CBS 260.36]|uniref:holo-[acyl-carrier-protein] synthase n=1 Tax=Myriangium duriaei CBS 260.36 TaxID=1168546 RepID=A0A9P4MJ76_9PEZI|nr:hypothetical protein K461DRAFT_223055 [Myriangium duriaei CBS 260.36]
MAPSQEGKLTLWMMDTRTIWPGTDIKVAARDALALVSTKEQVDIKRKVFIKDARMSLASALLKRLYISQALSIQWSEVAIARRDNPDHGKPAALLPDGSFADIDFNVSHQGGLVTLIGWAPEKPSTLGGSTKVFVGTDITLVNERDDYKTVDTEGMDGWVDMFSEVFSVAERWDMAYNVDYITLLDGTLVSGSDIGRADRIMKRGEQVRIADNTIDSELIIESKLRRFYAFFAYKEAYIKLAGEALLAPWLRELEFQNVRSPKPGVSPKCSGNGVWGERVSDVEVVLHRKRVEDVKMDLRAYDEGFMIASAVQGNIAIDLADAQYRILNLETDILEYARAH